MWAVQRWACLLSTLEFLPPLLSQGTAFHADVHAVGLEHNRAWELLPPRLHAAGADPEADSILEEQRTLEGAGKNDRESLVALVTEVRHCCR